MLLIGETRKHRGGVYGNLTLSRWKIERALQVDLSISDTEERLQRAPAHRFSRAEATGCAPKEADSHGGRHFRARVVLGDFNDWTEGLVTRTLSTEFHDLCAHLLASMRYPVGSPLLAPEYLFFDHHIKIEGARFWRNRLSLIASDHLRWVVDLMPGGV
jgi:endonuclease/exonuclease/phosphatase family metal-dependent hydrolase